jgi:hypothetical protein
MKPTRAQLKQLAIDNSQYPEHLIPIPRERWSPAPWDETERTEVWRSRKFLVQVFAQKDGAQRITVCTTRPQGHTWQAGIAWDDLQRLKAECGRGDAWAVEIYPAESSLVNVANMRHLWILPAMPEYAWREGKS